MMTGSVHLRVRGLIEDLSEELLAYYRFSLPYFLSGCLSSLSWGLRSRN